MILSLYQLLDHVAECLRALERSVSVSEVEQLFCEKRYDCVVERLLPLVEQGTDIPSEVS